MQDIQCKLRDFFCNLPVVLYFREISDPLQQPVRQTGRSAGSSGNLIRSLAVNLNAHDGGGTGHDFLQVPGGIEIHLLHNPEAVP